MDDIRKWSRYHNMPEDVSWKTMLLDGLHQCGHQAGIPLGPRINNTLLPCLAA